MTNKSMIAAAILEMNRLIERGMSIPDAASEAIFAWDSFDDLNLLGYDGVSAVIAEAIKISPKHE